MKNNAKKRINMQMYMLIIYSNTYMQRYKYRKTIRCTAQ